MFFFSKILHFSPPHSFSFISFHHYCIRSPFSCLAVRWRTRLLLRPRTTKTTTKKRTNGMALLQKNTNNTMKFATKTCDSSGGGDGGILAAAWIKAPLLLADMLTLAVTCKALPASIQDNFATLRRRIFWKGHQHVRLSSGGCMSVRTCAH